MKMEILTILEKLINKSLHASVKILLTLVNIWDIKLINLYKGVTTLLWYAFFHVIKTDKNYVEHYKNIHAVKQSEVYNIIFGCILLFK